MQLKKGLEVGSAKSTNETVKALFKSQWVNGGINDFMQSVKRRTKEAYNIDLKFSNTDEFLNELIKYDLLSVLEKP